MEQLADMFKLASFYKNLEINETDIDDYNEDQTEALFKLVSKKKEFERHNRLAYFEPYDYQKEWIAASLKYRQRYLSAANR
ncbi:hypothetical protein D1804_14995 [Salmonella enterica subsp. enterica serovar Lagos]|nr:hypothetical protein [Salmonella enterica subsp. enterica serovar Lagos]